MPAEVTMQWVYFIVLGIISYFILCTIHFIFFLLRKPKVRGGQQLRCVRVSYCVGWLLLVVIVVSLEILCFLAAWSISQYNRGWIHGLLEVADFQSCT